jgi:hypothetical protein
VTYNELFETIKGYTENDFPNTQYGDPSAASVNFTSAEQINTFIRQAEQRIYNSVQFPPIRKNVTGPTTANNKYLSSPGDFLSVFSMAVIDPTTGAYDFLLNKDVNFIREAFTQLQPAQVSLSIMRCLGQQQLTLLHRSLQTSYLLFWDQRPTLFTILSFIITFTQSLSLLLVLLGLEITLTPRFFMVRYLRHTPT